METNSQGLKYAGFWRRLGAHLIDTVIWMVPVFSVQHFLSGNALKYSFISWAIISMIVSFWYHVFLTVQFGGTPGFRLMKAKIRKESGEPVGVREAFLRYMVLYVFAGVMNIGSIIGYLNVSDDYFSNIFQNSKILLEATPQWVTYSMYIMQAWLLAEFLVLFTNKQRRVISDYIAGTVVLQDPAPTLDDAKTDFVG
jgi:uncharacterized RDD family membrane protein YckC